MPFIRFNCEPSKVEEGVRFRASVEAGLVIVKAERRPSTSVQLSMTPAQATVLSDLLRRESRVQPQAQADRRPRLAEDGR